ncbi:peptidoglycan recognition protein family protein [Phyllobacterium ifriqiyense]|uniref:peptidoglycan recognition protein family protein n=1 Tax=Phyllobacterium ifriqiyense TaxID=314238 RepID=UPI003396888D
MNIPTEWMPKVSMLRIICHWTAGGHKASEFDREHYHLLIEDDGRLIRGIPSIADNVNIADGKYAAHTKGCNTGSIGISLCCMAGAVESPFSSGKAPMTRAQWDALVNAVAELCRQYKIPVTSKTVLSHAEVQANLGIPQRQKWDIARLSFDPSVKGAKACGDKLRAEVTAKLKG